MMMSIINSCDVYISMHKSEGFGIGMLEAMFLSKPVIATNYGGNTDFMNHDNSLLLKYKMTEVINDFGPYKKGLVMG
jgi:glycosyltransferase involved in cell wall biosynthesis